MRQELPDVWTYEIELADLSRRKAYAFRPGQFNMLYLPGVGEAAISISGDSEAGGPVPTQATPSSTVRVVFEVGGQVGSTEALFEDGSFVQRLLDVLRRAGARFSTGF